MWIDYSSSSSDSVSDSLKYDSVVEISRTNISSTERVMDLVDPTYAWYNFTKQDPLKFSSTGSSMLIVLFGAQPINPHGLIS